MTRSQTELEITVERVRAEHFPTLPADLVGRILVIEEECVENRSEAVRRVLAAIQAFIDTGSF